MYIICTIYTYASKASGGGLGPGVQPDEVQQRASIGHIILKSLILSLTGHIISNQILKSSV